VWKQILRAIPLRTDWMAVTSTPTQVAVALGGAWLVAQTVKEFGDGQVDDVLQ
jgi:hypothetical protein